MTSADSFGNLWLYLNDESHDDEILRSTCEVGGPFLISQVESEVKLWSFVMEEVQDDPELGLAETAEFGGSQLYIPDHHHFTLHHHHRDGAAGGHQRADPPSETIGAATEQSLDAAMPPLRLF